MSAVLQAEETETCPLTVAKFTSSEPLILFLIDVSTLRCVRPPGVCCVAVAARCEDDRVFCVVSV